MNVKEFLLLLAIISLILGIFFLAKSYKECDNSYLCIGFLIGLLSILTFACYSLYDYKAEKTLKSEIVYIQELSSLEENYYTLSADRCHFTFFDGKLQQTLSGGFKVRVHFEDVDKPYIKVEYQADEDENKKTLPLDEREIKTIDVYLDKKTGE